MLRIGTSGFSYDDWKGEVYPKNLAKKDMLAWYTRWFETLEVNSTYYTIPSPRSFSAMADKSPDGFDFVVKAHQDMTHADKAVDDSFESFKYAITPLLDRKKLGCVLAQYPWKFKKTRENEDRLRHLKDKMPDIPLVVEFRNADWVTDDTFGLLKSLDIGFCAVDEPDLPGLMPRISLATNDIGYVRFHGRNCEKWWKHENAYERYDYLYNEKELSEWKQKLEDLEQTTEKCYVFFNTHYKGKSVINASKLASILDISLPLDSTRLGEDQLSLGDF